MTHAEQMASSPDNESLRRALGVERGCKEALSDLTFLAASYLNTPYAGISIAGENESHYLTTVGGTVVSLPSSQSICFDVATSQETCLISGLGTNPKLSGNSALANLGVRAYAGVPLYIKNKYYGALCVMDREVRHWSAADVASLHSLANAVTKQLEQSCA